MLKLIITGLIISIFMVIVLSPKLLVAKQIECYTQYGLCPGEWFSSLESLKNTALLRPLPITKAKQILTQFSQIDNFSLFRRLPSTLVVSIQLRKPLGTLSGSNQVLGVADHKGLIFTLALYPDLPLLSITEKVDLNQQLSTETIMALHALSKLNAFSTQPVRGILERSNLKVQINPTTTVVINVNKDPDSWATPLHLILNRSKISPKSPATIDLRFNNPVISYQ